MGPFGREKNRKIPPDFCRKPAIWQDAMAEVKRTFQKVAEVKQSKFSGFSQWDQYRWGAILSRNRRAKINSQLPSTFGSIRLPQEVLDELRTNRSQSPYVSMTHVQNVLGMWNRIEAQSTRRERKKNPHDWRVYPVFIRRPPAAYGFRGSGKVLIPSNLHAPLAYSPPAFSKLHEMSSPPKHGSKRPTTPSRPASSRPFSANDMAKRPVWFGGLSQNPSQGDSERHMSRHNRMNNVTPKRKPWGSPAAATKNSAKCTLESSERLRSKSTRISHSDWIVNLYSQNVTTNDDDKIVPIPKHCIERPPSRCKRWSSSSTSESIGEKISITIHSGESYIPVDSSSQGDRSQSSNGPNLQCRSEDSHIKNFLNDIQSRSQAENEDIETNTEEGCPNTRSSLNLSERSNALSHGLIAVSPFGLPAMSRNTFERPPSRRRKELSKFSSMPNSSHPAENHRGNSSVRPSPTPPRSNSLSSDQEQIRKIYSVETVDSDYFNDEDDEEISEANNSPSPSIVPPSNGKNSVESENPSQRSSSSRPAMDWTEQNRTYSKASTPFLKSPSKSLRTNTNAGDPWKISDTSIFSSLEPGSSTSSVESSGVVERKLPSEVFADFRNSIIHTITSEGLENEEEIEEVCQFFLDLNPPSYRQTLVKVITEVMQVLKATKS